MIFTSNKLKQISKYLLYAIFLFTISSCTNNNKKTSISELDSFMNKWHHAAATANEDIFFGMMDANGIYLGTDSSELWTSKELQEWAEPYFSKDTAWAFTPISRHWYFSNITNNIVWFDELLKTNMGICRGSGVLEKTEKIWKIKQYNLCLTIPNEIMQEVVNLSKSRKLNIQ